MDNIIEVSILCNTYNQADYISEALESFLSQETTFNYEILVHDDASTDGTKEIIEEYHRRYPHLIKPTYEDVNKYSNGINITMDIMVPQIISKYTALCEGDDYWTDRKKLQKQYDLMEKNPEHSMCAHASIMHNEKTGEDTLISPMMDNGILAPAQVIAGGGGYLATNSLFMRTNMLRNPMPFRKKLQMDYTMQIQGSLPNGILFIRDIMSVYRYLAKGSWTIRMSKKTNYKKKKEFTENYTQMLLQLNNDTNYQYQEQVDKLLIFDSIIIENSMATNLHNFWKYKKGMKYLSGKEKIQVIVKTFMPYAVKLKHKLFGK